MYTVEVGGDRLLWCSILYLGLIYPVRIHVQEQSIPCHNVSSNHAVVHEKHYCLGWLTFQNCQHCWESYWQETKTALLFIWQYGTPDKYAWCFNLEVSVFPGLCFGAPRVCWNTSKRCFSPYAIKGLNPNDCSGDDLSILKCVLLYPRIWLLLLLMFPEAKDKFEGEVRWSILQDNIDKLLFVLQVFWKESQCVLIAKYYFCHWSTRRNRNI